MSDWKKLNDPAYVGGAVRDKDDRGRIMHRRIARIEFSDHTIAFRFDRVAILVRGAWQDVPLEDNDYLWFPHTLMPVAFDADGTARPGSREFPAFIDTIHPRAALPAESPSFGELPN
ncbi:MAG TPA: hypothetical protein VL500_05790 [Candidatus Eisenbacteria bacterium]|nr:hypothetical protein [Candidatus Eisenbacteria bacterium]